MLNSALYCGIDYSLRSPAVAFYNKNSGLYSIHFMSMVKRAVATKSDYLFGTPYVTFETQQERLDKISDWVMALLSDHNPLRVGIEDYSFGSQGSSILQIAENTGLLKHKVYKAKIPFSLVAPTSVKKFATKNGGAGKFSMEQQFIKETGHDVKKELGVISENPSSDIIDAYYIATYMASLKDAT